MKKAINAPIWRTDDGLDLPINCVRGSGCYVEILNAIYMQLMAMLSHHNKVLVVRVDIHLPDNPEKNTAMSEIVEKFKRRLLRKEFSLKRLGYIWVREASKNGCVHYHLVYMVDGNKQRTAFKLNALLEEAIMFVDAKINIHFCTGNKEEGKVCCYSLLKRDNKQGLEDIFHWLSYLAKERSKGQRPLATNDYYSSQIALPKLSH